MEGAVDGIKKDIQKKEAAKGLAKSRMFFTQSSELSGELSDLRIALEDIWLLNQYRKLITAFTSDYPMFSGYLYKEMSEKLQFIDSEICLAVIEKLMAQRIVCLTVHDSFIDQRQHEPELRQVVREAYRVHPKLKGVINTTLNGEKTPCDGSMALQSHIV